MASAVAVRVVGDAWVERVDAEATVRSRRAMARCTRGAGVVAKVFFWTCPFLIAPLRRERCRQNTLAWTKITRGGDRGLPVDSEACDEAVRVVEEVGVEEADAEAAARSRRAMERCTRGATRFC